MDQKVQIAEQKRGGKLQGKSVISKGVSDRNSELAI